MSSQSRSCQSRRRRSCCQSRSCHSSVACTAMGGQVSTIRALKQEGRRRGGDQHFRDRAKISILAFEVANLMSKCIVLWQSLNDPEISRLRSEVIRAEGVLRLVSDSEAVLLSLACKEKLQDLMALAGAVARLGKKCHNPALQGFEHVFSDVLKQNIDLSEFEFSPKEMEGKVKKMERYIASTSNLYQELEILADLEQAVRRIREEDDGSQRDSLTALEQKISWQRQEIKYLRDLSLWNRTYDKIVLLLAKTICTIHGRIVYAFGPPAFDLGESGAAFGSRSNVSGSISNSRMLGPSPSSCQHQQKQAGSFLQFCNGSSSSNSSFADGCNAPSSSSPSGANSPTDNAVRLPSSNGDSSGCRRSEGRNGYHHQESETKQHNGCAGKKNGYHYHSQQDEQHSEHVKDEQSRELKDKEKEQNKQLREEQRIKHEDKELNGCVGENGYHHHPQQDEHRKHVKDEQSKELKDKEKEQSKQLRKEQHSKQLRDEQHSKQLKQQQLRATSQRLFFDPKFIHHAAPSSTLGGSALALHYANVIIIVEKMVKFPQLVGNDARDDLYRMLPRSVRLALRSQLHRAGIGLGLGAGAVLGQEGSGSGGGAAIEAAPLSDAAAAVAAWRGRVEGVLAWLAPLAHNMIRWQSEHNFEQAVVSRTNVLLLQTLYFADAGKAEAAIVELLVALNHLCWLEKQMRAHMPLDYSSGGAAASAAASRELEDYLDWRF